MVEIEELAKLLKKALKEDQIKQLVSELSLDQLTEKSLTPRSKQKPSVNICPYCKRPI